LVQFDKEKHRYADEHGNEFISVTTLIKKYSNEFDPTGEITQRYAFKNGLSVEQVKAQWELKAKTSRDRGTFLHKVIEDYLNTGMLDQNYYTLINEVNKLGLTGNKKCEVVLYNEKYKLAGITDLVINGCEVYDWKTNKVFNYFSKYNQKLLHPLDHLDDCEYNKYAIQLSLYGYMLGTVRRLGILWINPEYKIQYIPVPYMKQEVEYLLQHYKMTFKKRLIFT